MPISALKLEIGTRVVAEHLNHSSHIATNKLYGGGYQDIADQLLSHHHHVHPILFEEVFGSSSALAIRLPRNIWALSGTAASGYRYTGSFDMPASQLLVKANHSKFAFFLMHWISGGDVGNIGVSGFDLYNVGSMTKFGVDSSAPNHFFYTGAQDNSAVNGYGFGMSSLFAGPLPPGGIRLTGDVGGNATFDAHARDGRIHKVQIDPPTPTSDNDHMSAHYGFLNVYDIASGDINFRTDQIPGRVSDQYPFDLFDSDMDDLDKVSNPNADIAHPMLYEEGAYFFHDRKVRQFKLIKAFPDDAAMTQAKRAALPMDSLFIGGGPENRSVFYSEASGQYVETVNTALDSYWYDNYYIYALNREWKGGIGYRYIEFAMFDGLGYQPRSGLSMGV